MASSALALTILRSSSSVYLLNVTVLDLLNVERDASSSLSMIGY